MKIRPKTFKLLKELLLEKGGVFYDNGRVVNFEFNGDLFYDYESELSINSQRHLSYWLTHNDWHIKV